MCCTRLADPVTTETMADTSSSPRTEGTGVAPIVDPAPHPVIDAAKAVRANAELAVQSKLHSIVRPAAPIVLVSAPLDVGVLAAWCTAHVPLPDVGPVGHAVLG